MPQKKKLKFRQHQSLIGENGKVVSRIVTDFTVVKDQDSFFRIYIDHVADLNKLSNTEKKFLLAVASMVQFNTNEICFNGSVNATLCDLAGITDGVRRSLVSTLTKKGMFIRIGYLIYQLNPLIFFKGSDIERSNILSMEYRWKIVDKDEQLKQGEQDSD